MNKSINIYLLSLLFFIFILSSCTTTSSSETVVSSANTQNIEVNNETETLEEFSPEMDDLKLKTSNLEVEEIVFSSDSISYSGDNAFVSGTTLTITKAGNYYISGTSSDAQIVVETDDEEAVQIYLDDLTLSNQDSSVIYVKNSKQTILNMVEGTVNTFTDSKNYSFETEEDEPNATIFSKDELVITGNGKLVVNANYNDAISSKDELYILSGDIVINSIDDGIRGKDYLQIDGGTINITSQGDSLKSDNEEEGQIYINGGDITISSGDDGVHSEKYLEINGGNIYVTKSYEALESAVITINGGNIDLTSSDDAINAAGGTSEQNDKGFMSNIFGGFNDGKSEDYKYMKEIKDKQRNGETLTEEEQSLLDEMEANRPQRDGGYMQIGGESVGKSNYFLYINGGVIKVNSSGDGLDANGDIVMTGGEVIVAGPTSSGNGFLDYDGTFVKTGGSIIAYGSSGMLQNISTSSTDYSVTIGFDTTYNLGDIFSIKNSSGEEVVSVTFVKNAQAIVVSIEDFKLDETYAYYINGEKQSDFTISSIVTTVGNVQSGGMGRRGF